MATEKIRVTIEYLVDGEEHSSSTFVRSIVHRVAPVDNVLPFVVGHTFATLPEFGGGVVRVVGTLRLKDVDEMCCGRSERASE